MSGVVRLARALGCVLAPHGLCLEVWISPPLSLMYLKHAGVLFSLFGWGVCCLVSTAQAVS